LVSAFSFFLGFGFFYFFQRLGIIYIIFAGTEKKRFRSKFSPIAVIFFKRFRNKKRFFIVSAA